MIKIGFDDEEPIVQEDDEEEVVSKVQKEKSAKKKLSVYIPPRRIEEFKKNYDCVVVNDFGDDYHLSDEEREKNNECYSIFKNFSRCKHKYRKVEQYVIAMREFLKCLDFVAELNGVYDPDKFKKLYLKGEINITGLFIPKFIGKARKTISTDYLTEFILSDEDPHNIVRKRYSDDIYTDKDIENFSSNLFMPGQLEECMKPITEEEEIKKLLPYDESLDNLDQNIVVEMGDKQLKKMLKSFPDVVTVFKDAKDRQRSIASMSRYAFDITSEDLDYIDRYDRKHNIISTGNMPKFKGNLKSDADYYKYLELLEEWEDENIFDDYHGKVKSLGDIKELELKQFLEENGWNIRNLYENKEKEKKMKKQLKRDKKREKELRQKLIDIDRRRKRRMGEDVEESIKKKKKKKDKESKALKKDKKQMKKKMNMFLDSHANTDKSVLDWRD